MAILLQPISQPPLPPPPRNHESKPTSLSRKGPKLTHPPPPKSHSLSTTHRHHYMTNGHVNSSNYASILESCECPNLGKQIHAHTLKNGFHGHEFVDTKLLNMYGKCGCFDDATKLFDKMPLRNLYSWTAILSLYVDNGFFEEAFGLFQELLFEDVELEFFVFPVMLKVCRGFGMVELGGELHGIAIKYGFASNIYVGNGLIDMYGKCGSVGDAKRLLNTMPNRDCISWNSMSTGYAMNGMVYEALECLEKMTLEDKLLPNLVSWSSVIGGFSQNGYDEEAIEMLYKMQAAGFEPNARTLASVLPACARLEKLSLGKEIHGYITRHRFMSNPFVVNGLVDVYRRCADMRSAIKIFSKFSVKNDVSYNTIIVGYCQNGEISKAKELFDHMELAGMKKDIISWNSMISGCTDNFMFIEALSMFRDLLMEEGIEADSYTLGSALTACVNMGFLRGGRAVHSQAIVRGLQSNTFVGGALVELYSKCHDLKAAEMAFSEVNERDTATWNALISGYAHCKKVENVQNILQKMKENGFKPNVYTWNGIIAGQVENDHNESALQLFFEMQTSNLRPDIYTTGIVLTACSRLATIERGKQVHGHSVRCGYESEAYIGAALVDMYAKCGSIKKAHLAYNRIKNYSLVTQNAMLTAYAMHGRGDEGITFFRQMLVDGFRPDKVSFLSVLSSCVHAGAVETGHEFSNLMTCYNVHPTIKHYTCIVDLLSRAGQLNAAYVVIQKMAMEPDPVIWGALLGGCVIHGEVDLGEIAAKMLITLEPDNTGNYVMLANLYASAGRWCDLARTRQTIKEKQMHKNPGCSWIEDGGEMHIFVACDRSHEKAEEIYTILDNLTIQMKQEQD